MILVRRLYVLLIVAVTVAGSFGTVNPQRVSARTPTPSANEGSYSSPTYGYSLRYDPEQWQVTTDESEDDIDTLELTNDDSVLTLTGSEAAKDVETCLADSVDALLDERAYRTFNQAVNNDDEPYQGNGVLGNYTGYTDGDTAVYLECGLNPDETAQIVVRVVVALTDFGDQIGLIDDILSTVAWESQSGRTTGGIVMPTPPKRPTATPEGETETTSSGNQYVDDENGWSLTWDDTWELTSDPTSDTFLNLERGSVSVLVYVIAGVSDAKDCLSGKLDSLTDAPGVSNVSALKRDGKSVRGGDETAAYVAYVYDYSSSSSSTTTRMVDHYECRILPSGEDALMVSHIVVERLYDDEAPIVADLLKGLTIED